MTQRRDEERALSREELELSDGARPPALTQLGDGDLDGLVDRLRDRRDRARSIADRQRREARGKAVPSGGAPASGDEGTRLKARLLGEALQRAQDERDRRRNPPETQADLSRKALALKEAAGEPPPRPETQAADDGFQSIPNEDIAPSGALDAEGYKPVLERSRKVR